MVVKLIKKSIIAACLLFSMVLIFRFWVFIAPINIEDKKSIIISELKEEYGISSKLANIFYLAYELSGYSPIFIAELALSESGFNNNAKSSAGYKGIMQTPTRTGYIEADVIHGVVILMEKFKIAKGDTLKAITLYKGGTPLAEKQAKKFLSDYYERRIR